MLSQLDKLEEQASAVFNGTVGSNATLISEEARATASLLLTSSNELRDFVSSLKPPSADDNGSDEDVTVDAMRRRVEEQSGSAMDAVKSGLASILPMLDPPPHTSIFGFDVLRGTVLSRYLGARQFWVPRPSGGMLDVIHIPTTKRGPNLPRNPKAVMYCNPNAGLCEVATGMSLAGGNIGEDDANAQDCCWADFYTDQGLDIYLYNYAGFGRSFGTSLCVKGNVLNETFVPGIVGRLRRIFRASFCTFKVISTQPVHVTGHRSVLHLAHFASPVFAANTRHITRRWCCACQLHRSRAWSGVACCSWREYWGSCRLANGTAAFPGTQHSR